MEKKWFMGIDIAKKTLDGSYCTLGLKKGKECIGIVRIIGDGAYAYYFNDVIIAPDHRGFGYGRLIVSNAIDYIRSHMANEVASISLFSNPEASGFYEKLGFLFRTEQPMKAYITFDKIGNRNDVSR